MNQHYSLATLAVTFSLLLAAVPAGAADAVAQGTVRTAHAGDVVLQYRASELASDAGRARTYARLQSAAAQVCARYDSRELARQLVHWRCIDRLVTAAVLEIRNPELQALHNAGRGLHESRDATLPIRTARR